MKLLHKIVPVSRLVKVWPVFLLALIFFVTGCAGNSVPKEVTLLLDGKEFKEPNAEIHEGQVMVPGSFISSALGKKVEWIEESVSDKEEGEQNQSVYYSDQVAVLMYHHIMETPDRDDILSAEQFRQQMELLQQEGFQPIGMEQYLDFIIEGKSVPDNAVLITFDDGYESFYEHAFPVLKEFDYPAANFIIVSSIDSSGTEKTPKLTWEQMREMKKEKIDFYSHTYDMHRYGMIDASGKRKPVTTRNLYLEQEKRTETDEEYEQRVREDLLRAEERLKEELGNTRSVLALPYGAHHDKLLEIMDSVGIEASFTVKEGINDREDRNGFRINGGRSDQSPETVIAKLKGQDVQPNVLVKGEEAKLRIDGSSVEFSKVFKGDTPEDTLVPLREVCREFDIKVDWNHKKKRAVLTSAKTTTAENKQE
ncbi:polysaccharide deacetylase family protein [Paenibacillus faecalis]|uniref:polysaccharide deacetylase family protein n=1 Tax=Paenibacillus faecalis TaxID=2079532 RepID=UPI000D111722|nr:polysaccharide deacetylase family protein [Paenibacillus faecalis]